MLSAGKTLVSPDPRVTLNPDFSLEIKEVGPEDAGDYVCQIGTLEPKEITHTVEILGKTFRNCSSCEERCFAKQFTVVWTEVLALKYATQKHILMVEC